MRDAILYGTAPGIAADLLAEVDTSGADAIVTDFLLFGGYLAAERARLPLAALVHTIYLLPARGVPPPGLGLAPARGPAGRLRDAALWRVARRFYDARLPSLNALRAALGLHPLRSAFDLMAGARLLVLTSAAFDFESALPPNVSVVGFPRDPAADAPRATDGREAPRPFVLASMSTTMQGQERVLRRVIEALRELPVHALVTTGPAVDPASLPGAPRVAVERWAPHAEVLPRCDLVVTHGGHGTVLSALRHGVPVVCLPMGRDQADVAARVRWRGVGVTLSSGASPSRIREAIVRVLGEPSYRTAAARVAAAMARERPEAAVEALEALVAARPAAVADTRAQEVQQP